MAELFKNKGHDGIKKRFGISFVTMIVIKILKMKISNLNPSHRMYGISPLFSSFFENEFSNLMHLDQTNFTAKANVKETENNFNVEMAVPGFEKQDFEIVITENNVLKISAKKESKIEETEKETKVWRKEYVLNSFERNFTLPKNVQKDAIEASYTNGLLNITIPKLQITTSQTKMVEVK